MESDRKTPSNSKINKQLLSFAYALSGIKQFFKTERNAWIHLCVMLCVIFLGLIFSITSTEWVAVTLCFGLVLGAEAMNTAIEYLANYCTTEKNEQIRKVKDIAAGAVLLCAIAAIAVGLIVFLPKIKLLFST